MFDRKTCWDRHVHGSAAAAAPSGVAAAEGFPRSFCLPFLQKDVKEGRLASSLMASVIGFPPRAYIQIYQRLPLGLGQVNIRRCLRDVRGRPGSRETMVHRGLYEEVWFRSTRRLDVHVSWRERVGVKLDS